MRTNIVINDTLIADAMKSGNFKTKRETVEAGLALLVRLSKQQNIRAARGKLKWDGNLGKMRQD